MLVFLIPFWIIGISMIIAGTKSIKKIKSMVDDYNNNPILYGKIYDTHSIRGYNGQRIYNLDIAAYDTYSKTINQVRVQCADLGRFHTGIYVELKEIGGHHIINKRMLDTEVPIDAKIELDGIKVKDENGNSVNSKDTIIVNGVEYVRKNRYM